MTNKPTEENRENIENKEGTFDAENVAENKVTQEAPLSEEKAEDVKTSSMEDTVEEETTKKSEVVENGLSKTKEEESQEIVPEFIEKVISINRITKVTKGGKKLSFSALVVVGDTRGNVGYCLAKANEVATAIRKAMGAAKKNMVQVPMKGTTITHEIIGQCGGARVLLKPATEGTGVIASGPVRAVCDGAGIHNILTKCHRSNNPINVVKATIDGLSRLKTVN